MSANRDLEQVKSLLNEIREIISDCKATIRVFPNDEAIKEKTEGMLQRALSIESQLKLLYRVFCISERTHGIASEGPLGANASGGK